MVAGRLCAYVSPPETATIDHRTVTLHYVRLNLFYFDNIAFLAGRRARTGPCWRIYIDDVLVVRRARKRFFVYISCCLYVCVCARLALQPSVLACAAEDRGPPVWTVWTEANKNGRRQMSRI